MDKKQAIFNENDIPYKELELIGISKKQIWSLDKANITALLSGKRTSLLDLSFHDNNEEEFENEREKEVCTGKTVTMLALKFIQSDQK